MLLSVSYVCLGICTGMWIINEAINLGGHLGLVIPAFG